MEHWKISDGKRYVITVVENISAMAYVSSILIFIISWFMFEEINELSLRISGSFFVIGAVFALIDGFFFCCMPACYLERKKAANEDTTESIEELLDELELLDKEEQDIH